MNEFNPKETLKGQDVYVIGGGTSVALRDLTALRGKPVIGLNQAFAVIPEVIDYCIFGDTAFFHFLMKQKKLVESFKGQLITNGPLPIGVASYEGVQTFGRAPFMDKGKNFGWYGNTGILGIELAITLGAKRIYLLGYDNYNKDGKSHYHNYHKSEVSERALNMFQDQFTRANKVWSIDYPEVEIINLNPNSRLDMFKKKSGRRHLKGLKNGC